MNVVESLRNNLARLSPRERLMVVGAAVAVFGFAFYLVIYIIGGKADTISARIESNGKYLEEILKARAKYEAHKARQRALEQVLNRARPALRSFLGNLAKRHGLNIREYRDLPSPKLKKGKVQIEERSMRVFPLKPDLKSLTRFLEAIENTQRYFIVIRELRLQRAYDNADLLDNVEVTVSTFRKVSRKGTRRKRGKSIRSRS